MNNSTMEETVDRYIGSWNELTFETIKIALGQCCVAEVTYTDKQTIPPIQGLDQLAEHIVNTREAMPGLKLSVLTPADYFGGNCYYGWLVTLGEAEIVGCDYVEYNEKNLFTRIVAFAAAQ